MKKTISLLVLLAIAFTIFPALAEDTAEAPLRGIWVSSVINLDYPSAAGLSAERLQTEANDIINFCLETGMNAIFFQVRPCADALYRSEIFPTSVYLTGKSSFEPLNFDPLAYLTQEAHRNGIELHAWLNPYRVTMYGDADYNRLDKNSPAVLHPEYLLKAANGNYFFNPALPQVRELICRGVEEILTNYDVDGIHFDDYFYPDSAYDDSSAYAMYGGGYSDINEWRRENVNALVKDVHDLVKRIRPEAEFGISPRGVWANDYENVRGSATRGGGSLTQIHCDSLRFIEEEWVDYICPQIYWNIGFSAADYAILLPWWSKAVRNTNVKLYIGMADYRTAEAKEGSVWQGSAELRRQLELNKTYPAVAGEVHFRYKSIANNPELRHMYANEYGNGYSNSTGKMKETLAMLFKKILLGE